jgi:phage gp16-like protein
MTHINMMDKKNFKEFLTRQNIHLSEKEITEKYEQHQNKMLEAKCNLCQKEFSLENIKKGHFTKE